MAMSTLARVQANSPSVLDVDVEPVVAPVILMRASRKNSPGLFKNAFKKTGHQAELGALVGERDARRADLRVVIKGRQHFINIRIIARDRSRQDDPTGQGSLLAYPHASPMEAAMRIRAAIDQRFIEVKNEMRQQYNDVENFSPFAISERGAMGPEADRQWRYWGSTCVSWLRFRLKPGILSQADPAYFA